MYSCVVKIVKHNLKKKRGKTATYGNTYNYYTKIKQYLSEI